MAWWIWVILGLALLIAELLLIPGGFFITFFGIGAILVGLVVGVGIVLPVWLEWVLFTIFSVAALLLLRQRLLAGAIGAPGKDIDSLVGETATATSVIPSGGGNGKVELRGTVWNAINVGPVDLSAGAKCKVVAVDGLNLSVRGE